MQPAREQKQNPFSQVISLQDTEMARYFERLWTGGINGTKRNVAEILHDGQWTGRRCFIIGGGPSLRRFDYHLLDDFLADELSIGVNRAYALYPHVTINISSDNTFYREVTTQEKDCSYKRYQKFPGIKLWVDHMNLRMDDCYYIRSAGRQGISWTVNAIYTHSNTGYSAIQLALALGASPIYLLGYDLCEDSEGHTHWHDYATTKFHAKSWKVFSEGLDDLARRLKDSGRPWCIINLSHLSAVKAFPKYDFFQALDITQENYFKFKGPLLQLFYDDLLNRGKYHQCFVSDKELRSVHCQNVYQLEKLLGQDDPEYMRHKVFLRRAA